MATGPGFYDNLCPQSWQDGSAATFTLQDPHQQSKSPVACALRCTRVRACDQSKAAPALETLSDSLLPRLCLAAFDCPGN